MQAFQPSRRHWQNFILKVPSILMMDEIDNFLCVFKEMLPALFWLGKLRHLQGFIMVVWAWRAGAVCGGFGGTACLPIPCTDPVPAQPHLGPFIAILCP